MSNDKDDVRIRLQEATYRGYLKVEAYYLTHRRFDGDWMPEIRREVLRRGAAVAVMLYDPDRDTVLLIEQFRIGAYVNGRPPWVIEIVAGMVEPGEDPAAVARREAFEEAGCEVLDLVPIYDYVVSPGCMDETVSFYCGRITSGGLGGHHGLADEGEDIRVVIKPFEDAWAELAQGRLGNSITIIGMQWLKINRDDLRRRWSATPKPSAAG